MFFTFMGLIEYLFALTYANMITDAKAKYQKLLAAHQKRAEEAKESSGQQTNGQVPSTLLGQCEESKNRRSIKRKVSVAFIKVLGLNVDFNADPMNRNKIDYVARFAFPALYLIFIIGYFTVFVTPWMQIQQNVFQTAESTEVENDSL